MTRIQQAIVREIAKDMGLPAPVFEHTFAKPRRFRWDAAWPSRKLAIEIDGGVYGRGPFCKGCGRRKFGGAHSTPQAILARMEKNNLAVIHGWRYIVFTPLDAFGQRSGKEMPHITAHLVNTIRDAWNAR